MMTVLQDKPAERAVLSGIFKYGLKAYLDVSDILHLDSFTVYTNVILYKCILDIFKSTDDIKIDLPTIYSAANNLGVYQMLEKTDEVRYIKALFNFPIEFPNVRKFAIKIRKLHVTRLYIDKLDYAKEKLLEINGTETFSSIISIPENAILDFNNLIEGGDESPECISSDLEDYINYLIENKVDQIGIPTGFKNFDKSIGGGLRYGVNVIGARPKIGKTTLGINIANNISECDIPLLFLDSEMLKEDHVHKILAKINNIPVADIEKGNIVDGKKISQKLSLNKNYYHKSTGGITFEEQLSIMKRWIMKVPGLNNEGFANPCVIVYDYLKLNNADKLNNNVAEYQQIGFNITALHNLAVKYKIPILCFVQLNRDALTKEDTGVVSGSDRIIWLCTSFTIFKEKSDEEIACDGIDEGNRKLTTLASRYGPGTSFGDYINCEIDGKYGRVLEKKTKFGIEYNKQNEGFLVGEDDIPFS